jgi:hypothetical protein
MQWSSRVPHLTAHLGELDLEVRAVLTGVGDGAGAS